MPRKQPPRTIADDLGPRARRLYEVSGHLGPWSREEFAAAGVCSAVNEPPPPRRDELPADVLEAVEAVEAARAAFDAAHEAWLDTIRARAAFEANPRGDRSLWVNLTGNGGDEPGRRAQRKLDKLRDAENAAGDVRDRAGDELVRAKSHEQRVRKAREDANRDSGKV